MKKYVLILLSTVAAAAFADVNSSLPPMSGANTNNTADPCLNNPNIYVQQSCRQAQQAIDKRTVVTNMPQNPATQPPMPAWQQALQHGSTGSSTETPPAASNNSAGNP